MNQHKTTAQDFFLNVGVMATLYVTVVSFLSLFFNIINKLFPDSLAYYYDSYSSGSRFAIASLIIVFPLFLWLSRIVTKIITKDPERREMGVRKWLIYVTLFLASAALVVDLITLLNYFLSGEITTRFVLKVISVLVIAGLVFWHYLSEVRGTHSEVKYRAIFWTSVVLVLALLITAFSVFGSPANTRRARADETRVYNLQSVQSEVINYWQQKGRLPAEFADLKDSLSNFDLPKDPESDESYVYEKTGAKSFKLCATFNLSSKPKDTKSPSTRMYGFEGLATENWQHGAGLHCFDRLIDAEFYPVKTVPTGL